MTEKYKDIIHLPHPVSKKHPPMSIHDRAAQFAPFAALTGHGEAIQETARLTVQRPELDEAQKELLDRRLQALLEQIEAGPEVTLTYFRPDKNKSGGACITLTGQLKKIDSLKTTLTLSNHAPIPVQDILDIEENEEAGDR